MRQSHDGDPVTGWRALDSPWYATEIVHCQLCGQMIAGRVWVVEDGGRVHRFCGPECERTHATYWVPRYRRTGSSPPART